jgi:multimeric flavodoxin WrbA
MKILALNTSPHAHGNTRFLLDQLLEAAQAAGAETELLQINPLKIRGCQGDYGCKTRGRCVMQDDMQGVYDRIDQADVVVFGSPVYMWNVSAQLKTVLDRLFCYLNLDHTSRLAPGKRSVVLVAQNQPDGDRFKGSLDPIVGVLQLLGFAEAELLVAPGVGGLEAAAARPDLVQAARSLGERLAVA